MAIFLADNFFSQLQPQAAIDYFRDTQQKKDKKANKKNTKTKNLLNQTTDQIIAFRKDNSLGVYGKARLQLTFMNRLNELGYPEDITRQINEIILLRTP